MISTTIKVYPIDEENDTLDLLIELISDSGKSEVSLMDSVKLEGDASHDAQTRKLLYQTG